MKVRAFHLHSSVILFDEGYSSAVVKHTDGEEGNNITNSFMNEHWKNDRLKRINQHNCPIISQ